MENRIMMNKVNLKCIVRSITDFAAILKKIMELTIKSTTIQIEYNLILDSLTINDVKKIVSIIEANEYLKNSKIDSIVTFVLTIKSNKKMAHLFSAIKGNLTKVEIVYDENDITDMKYLIKYFSKIRIPCAILIKENKINEIMLIYDNISQFKMPICVDEKISIEDLNLNEFLKWAYDINGTKLNIFSDIAEYIILNYWGTCCKYKSCLTKYFTIDNDGNIYSCRNKKNLIGNVYEINQFEDVLNSKAFLDILKTAISLRELCKNKCEYYNICQGGCPLSPYESFDKCRERIYFSVFNDIEQNLKQIVRKEDYRNLNPALRDIILYGAASNKLFEGDFFN